MLQLATMTQNKKELTVFDAHGRPIGRLYEDGGEWSWEISSYAHPLAGVVTSGIAPNLDAAKAAFLATWQRWFASAPTEWAS
jgi:hypothetical protein